MSGIVTDTPADRVLASTCEPRTDPAGRVPRFADYTVSADLDNPWRWVVYYAPTVTPEFPDDADARTKIRARIDATKREDRLRTVAGVIEQGNDLVSWYAHRPHRGAVGGTRHFRTYGIADEAVAEICRRDRAYRKKGR